MWRKTWKRENWVNCQKEFFGLKKESKWKFQLCHFFLRLQDETVDTFTSLSINSISNRMNEMNINIKSISFWWHLIFIHLSLNIYTILILVKNDQSEREENFLNSRDFIFFLKWEWKWHFKKKLYDLSQWCI